MDFVNFRIPNGLKRILIFEIGRLFFKIGGQRFAQFVIDLSKAPRQFRKPGLECFGDVLVLSHVRVEILAISQH